MIVVAYKYNMSFHSPLPPVIKRVTGSNRSSDAVSPRFSGGWRRAGYEVVVGVIALSRYSLTAQVCIAALLFTSDCFVFNNTHSIDIPQLVHPPSAS